MKKFELISDYKPTGDQPQAIDALAAGIMNGEKFQTLVGVTGSGKTFTMANVIERVQRPTLVLAHNKTLAAQLCGEFREFFPHNAVEYFVSYYDYYLPESYIPQTDTFIEKDSSVNDEIDRLRHSATQAVLERRDVIVVASVSCIYGIGSKEDYTESVIRFKVGECYDRDELLRKLVHMQFNRNDIALDRGTFRVRGDILELQGAEDERITRISFFGDEVENIRIIDPVTGEIVTDLDAVPVYPATHFVMAADKMERALKEIEAEMLDRIEFFRKHDKLLEAQRIEQRTRFDMEMIKELGYCSGIENYSRILDGRAPGSTPHTLVEYFPRDFLLFIDESHQSVPQLGAMYAGDRSRKETLVDYGFRLPSALDNRPLRFNEFESLLNQVVFVSATPGPYEESHSTAKVEQIIRPTGLLDPKIDVRPTEGQIDNLIGEINERVERKERVLVTTLNKKMSEDLSEYLEDLNIRVRYLHSSIKTLERTEILRDLRLGVFDVLVGINLLREGLDLPEVSLVAILDADKEGFLRSETSLIQTIGRAARNVDGKVIMYADTVTGSMQRAIDETNRRRAIQNEYNEEHGIVPKTVVKDIRDIIEAPDVGAPKDPNAAVPLYTPDSPEELEKLVSKMEKDMKRAAKALDFETAAALRDEIARLKSFFRE
ncbi:MAG: excinuclease ABC subunit UvrB [Abditibacteriota bacterium]|nr:excinuclease ABC subunit UvrB [Abditibacteriota bacterium]